MPILLALILALFPLGAFAATPASTLPAGFAEGPLWLSTTTPREGVPLQIFLALYNASAVPLSGTVSVLVDGAEVGTLPLSLAAGAAEAASVPWTPKAGTHSISASIASSDGSGAGALGSASAAAVSVSISEAPKTPSPVAADPKPSIADQADALGTKLTEKMASTSPALASAVNAFTGAAEKARLVGASALAGAAGAALPGEVLGAETESEEMASTTASADADPGLLGKAAGLLLPLFASPAIFYPLFFLLLVLLVRGFMKKLQNPGARRGRARTRE